MNMFRAITIVCLCCALALGFPLYSDARGGGGGKGHAGVSHSFGGKHSSTSSGSSSTYYSKGHSKSTGSKKSYGYKKSKSSASVTKFSTKGKSKRLSAGSSGYKHVKYSKGLTFDGTVKRDSNGRIARSESAKHDFLKMRGYDKVPPGYHVDHITPLYAGGKDDPSNMQLISVAEHHAKTKADFAKYGR